MNARPRLLRIPLGLVVLMLCVAANPTAVVEGHDGSDKHAATVFSFPPAPDTDSIGTHVGTIDTHVDQVTMTDIAPVRRLGLSYWEIRGTIKGVGWGGSTSALLQCPYEYDLPYVLRIPRRWDGGLVIYRHQFDT